jgi:hypothetical protein
MAMPQSSGDQVNSAAQRGPCCELSSGRTLPATVPASIHPLELALVAEQSVVAIPVPRKREAQARTVPFSPDTSPQARFCTFLI